MNFPVSVWDVPDTTNRIRVDTTTTTCLKTHLSQDWFEVRSCWEKRQFDHTSSTKASTQIGRTSQNPSKMIWVHEIETLFFQTHLNLLCCKSKTFNDSFYIITLFHWDDSHVIFFVDPDEEIFVFIGFIRKRESLELESQTVLSNSGRSKTKVNGLNSLTGRKLLSL